MGCGILIYELAEGLPGGEHEDEEIPSHEEEGGELPD